MKNFKEFYPEEFTKELEEFCAKHSIKKTGREYIFELEGIRYIVSPYRAKVSDAESTQMIKQVPYGVKPTVRIRALKKDVMNVYNWLISGLTVKEIRLKLKARKEVEEMKKADVAPRSVVSRSERAKAQLSALLKKGR